jgi:hypothetical protein
VNRHVAERIADQVDFDVRQLLHQQRQIDDVLVDAVRPQDAWNVLGVGGRDADLDLHWRAFP